MVIEVKKDGQWIKIPYITADVPVYEAPVDGKQYARKDGNWSEVVIPDIDVDDVLSDTSENPVQNKVINIALADKLDDAPSDGSQYVRKNASWSKLGSQIAVTMLDNHGDDTAFANQVATLSYNDTSVDVLNNSITDVPADTDVLVSFPEVTGYTAPSMKMFNLTTGLATATGTYHTCIVTVTISGILEETGIKATVTYDDVSIQLASGESAKIPYNKYVTVTVPTVQSYTAPSPITFTTEQANRDVSMIYIYNPILYSYITLDQTITDSATMLSGDINGEAVQAIRNNSHRVLGKYTATGEMTYYPLKDDDGTKYDDGSAATLTGGEGDVFMKLPVFYWQCVEQSTDVFKIGLAYGGDPGEGWNKWEGDKELLGVYESYNSSSKAYSRSGVVSTPSVSQANWKTYARNRGNGFTLVTWEWHCIMALLYYCQYGHMNCQAQIGAGVSSDNKTMGQSDSLGMEDTKASTNGNSQSINFWGLENWWGNKNEWIDNVTVDARVWKIAKADGSGTRNAGTGGSSSGWTSKCVLGSLFDLIPTAISGSDTTGYCDYYYQSSSSSRVVLRSYSASVTGGGVAGAYEDYDSSVTYSSLGSRLAFRGNLVKASSVDAFKALAAIG